MEDLRKLAKEWCHMGRRTHCGVIVIVIVIGIGSEFGLAVLFGFVLVCWWLNGVGVKVLVMVVVFVLFL